MKTIRRKSCRAILLTSSKEILLIHLNNPSGRWTGWITPGGGVDPGEDEETALKRELFEELGLQVQALGPRVWKRFHRFPWNGNQVEQEEVFFLVRTERFAPVTTNLQATEMLEVRGTRWWTLSELERSNEAFSPTRLHRELMRLIESGPPDDLIDVGE